MRVVVFVSGVTLLKACGMLLMRERQRKVRLSCVRCEVSNLSLDCFFFFGFFGFSLKTSSFSLAFEFNSTHM